VGTAVSVSVGRDASVGGISVGGERGVAVETSAGVGAWGEQEMRRKRQDTSSRRDVMCWGMKDILTELSMNYDFGINVNTFRNLTTETPNRRLRFVCGTENHCPSAQRDRLLAMTKRAMHDCQPRIVRGIPDLRLKDDTEAIQRRYRDYEL